MGQLKNAIEKNDIKTVQRIVADKELDLLGDPRRMKTWILIVILAIFFSSNDGEWRVWKKDRRKDSLEFHATSGLKSIFFRSICASFQN